MSFNLTIKTDNDAFAGDPGAEVARLLRDIAEKVESGVEAGAIMDINGNRVGSFGLANGRPKKPKRGIGELARVKNDLNYRRR